MRPIQAQMSLLSISSCLVAILGVACSLTQPDATFSKPEAMEQNSTATATVNPVEDVQRAAGEGIIAWSIQMAFHPAFPIAVYNMWQSATADLRVFAGNTDDTNQGAVAVVPEYGDIYKPEIYVTAKKVGGLEIIDARGRRLVLRSYRTNDLFYFDISSRQFVATLQSEAPATVTPLPTFTPTATLMLAPVQDTEVVTPYPMHVATVVGSYP